MQGQAPVIYVVDDDDSVRTALRVLLGSVGMQANEFASAEEFLGCGYSGEAACLVLDVRMPGLGGLDLLDELERRNWQIPVIFITGHGDVPMSVRAMKKGAVDFLLKPFNEQELLDAVQRALAADANLREQRERVAEARQCVDALTPRELEVLRLVVAGHSNKEIGAILGAAENTIKIHRGRVMQKMQALSLPGLVRRSQDAGIKD
ncbi:DNA-binding response regulator [bacterium]|nr:MAG: DNA-binding response regulator [bacterium]RKZ15297.1 MAG: DNA-binding response regulator [bacterium]